MVQRILKGLTGTAAAAVLLAAAACADANAPEGGTIGCFTPAGSGATCINPSTIRVQNDLDGPVLFFKVRACGTTQFSEDLLPPDTINGTIQPGTQKDFEVEAGCYDLQAEHLETTDPGPLLTKSISDVSVSPVAIFTWTLTEAPGGPS